ncbi:MAG: SusC/RagA family TonB-linked outer membrane protein [Gemmatimonadota bacterium]
MRTRSGLLTALFLLLATAGAAAQQRTIRGTVTDEGTGEPISFPQVSVQNTQIGTIGDENGAFVLEDVPAGEVMLVVQRIGYRSREVPVAADVSSASVQLTVDYLQVEELVVTGRATETRRVNAPNSIESIQGEALERVPQQTLDAALQGRVTGAVIASNSGAPGGGLQLEIRGSSSVNAASEPLYVVDGVVMSNIAIPSNANEITQAAGGSNPSLTQDVLQNRIADLNPEEIESIEVLKGASAAAIYGVKASNGVVIITTKRGQIGPPRIRGKFMGGFFDLSNTLGFRTFATEEEAVARFGPTAAQFFQPGVTFDNEEGLAGRNDFSWDASASVSGGAAGGLSYFGSASWKNDEGIIENTGFERESARLNLSTALGRADINLSTNVLHTIAGRGLTNNDNSTTSYYMTFPSTPNFIDLSEQADGTFPVNAFVGNGSNPLQTAALLENDEEVWRYLVSGSVDLRVLESERSSVSLQAIGGVDFFNQENRIFSPPALHYESFDGRPGTALLSNSDNVNFNVAVNGIWRLNATDDIAATTSAGFNYDYSDLSISRLIGRDLTGGKDKVDAATEVQIRENQAKVEDFGFFLQEELLMLDERLLLTGMVRFDQSSANGDPSELFVFPKGAVSYRLAELGGILDEVKLRAAVGQTANRPLCDPREGCQKFTSLELDNNIEGIGGFQLEGTVGGGAALQPERMTEFEAGVDVTAWDGRGTLELTGYLQNVTDLIIEATVAPSTGFADVIFNGGELRNHGVEVALGLTPVASEGLTWVSRTSFFLNRSEVTQLDVPAFEADAGFGTALGGFFIEEGSSLTQMVGADSRCTGPGQPVEACRSVAGLVELGNSDPDFNMTFTNSLSLGGGLELFALLEWRKGQDVINLTELLFDLNANSADYGDPATFGSLVGTDFSGDECHPDCSGAERAAAFLNGFPRPYTQSASFLKAREISLSYALPEETVARLFGGFFDQIRVRASGRNLFTVTDYRGLDPEVSNFGNQQVGRSIDVAPFPPSRSFWLGFDFTL